MFDHLKCESVTTSTMSQRVIHLPALLTVKLIHFHLLVINNFALSMVNLVSDFLTFPLSTPQTSQPRTEKTFLCEKLLVASHYATLISPSA